MSIRQGSTVIAGNPATTPTNLVTTDTAQDITGTKTFVFDDIGVKTKDTRFARSDTAPGSHIYSNAYYMVDKNDKVMGALNVLLNANGTRLTRISANNHAGNSSITIGVGYTSSDTITTYAPACADSSSILTTLALSTSSNYTRLTFGNGVKIAAEYISGISGSSDYTWNYGTTFTEKPMVVLTRRSTATSTTAVDVWVRGEPGTSSCKIYSTLSSGSTYNVNIIAIGH